MSYGYQRLAQNDDLEEGQSSVPSPQRSPRRIGRPLAIDLSNIDAAFKRWTEAVAQKVKGKKKEESLEKREIAFSVFEPAVERSQAVRKLKTLDHNAPMSQLDFKVMIESVQSAISDGLHPKLIAKGSSGSYFARAKVDGRVKTLGVFKPKDEEPYGNLNPKTTKWLHRQFRWIIPFGRACLIPNLSYISEAAASLVDTRLNLNIVPRTELVSLSSPAFYYDWIDRHAAKKGKTLPDKIGSFQFFLHGYQDASTFLREHPWPGRSISDTFDDENHRKGLTMKRIMGAVKVLCGTVGDEDVGYEDEDDDDQIRAMYDPDSQDREFYWSLALQQDFRLELEKLAILDILISNTDRGADNYMIKYCNAHHEKPIVDVPPSHSGSVMSEVRQPEQPSATRPIGSAPLPRPTHSRHLTPTDPYSRPHLHIAAIDNSLAFPHEHPRGWRSFTYGWLFLPVSLIGRPFSEQTRQHFLPLLTSKAWWEETTFQLRKLHALDPDFHPKMFDRQLAVMKGQAWNIVQSLKHPDEGPLELTRRTKMLVWDEEIEVADDFSTENIFGPLTADPAGRTSFEAPPAKLTHPRRARSHSTSASGRDFPPPLRRSSTTDPTGLPRPIPFSAKFQRINPGATGVSVLEHMERLDVVGAGLKRLGMDDGDGGADDTLHEEDEEHEGSQQDRAESSDSAARPDITVRTGGAVEALRAASMQRQSTDSVIHARASSSGAAESSRGGRSLDWARPMEAASPAKRKVIAERMELINSKPFLSCW